MKPVQAVPVSLSCSQMEMKAIMLTLIILASVAKHMMTSKAIELDGKSLPVNRTGGHQLKTVAFKIDGRDYRGH